MYTHIKYLQIYYTTYISQQFYTLRENTTYLNCKYFKHQAIVEISLVESSEPETMQDYRLPSFDPIDIEFFPSFINAMPVDHHITRLHRWWRRMLWFDAATFHQPSQRNIAVQADAKWAFIAEIQQACGTANLRQRDRGAALSNLFRVLDPRNKILKKNKVKRKKAWSIGLKTYEVATQPRTESIRATAPKRVGVNNSRSWFYFRDVMFIGDSLSRLYSLRDGRDLLEWYCKSVLQ